MAFDLPPDPYKILGVTKDAKTPDIRSAFRKLALKCHPDKVQDAALKPAKQDEFQRLNQAYELLCDDQKRMQYDEQVHLNDLRKEMGRGHSGMGRTDPTTYNVRTAEPPRSFTRANPAPYPEPRVYERQPSPLRKSYEEAGIYEEPSRTAKKSASYETDRKTRSSKTDERKREQRKLDDEERARYEKEMKRAAQGEKRKSKDKEKRRGTEEKSSRMQQPYVDDDSDHYRSSPRDSKPSRHRMDDEIKKRKDESRSAESPRQVPLTPKWDGYKEYAAEYMDAARRKAKPADDDFKPPPIRKAETFAAPEGPKYSVRYAMPASAHVNPQTGISDEDSPRRSSARTATRRASETPSTRSSREAPKKEKESSKRSPSVPKRSPSIRTRERDPYIVDPSPPPPPKLATHSSAPPIIPVSMPRDKPTRSKTEYPSQSAPSPQLPRAKTFNVSSERESGKSRGGSRLKKAVEYGSSESENESPTYVSKQRHSHSPPPRRRDPEPQATRYFIGANGRSVPVIQAPHRSDMRNIDDEDYKPRDRSESPRARKSERPPLTRSGASGTGSRQASHRSPSVGYSYDQPEPIILTARPKPPTRESRGGGGRGSYFGEMKYSAGEPRYPPHEVKYSPNYGLSDATFSSDYRRGSDPSHHRSDHAYSSPRMRQGEILI